MCGISGWFDLKGMREPDQELIAAMNLAIAHRGPDGDGFYFAPGLGLGHRRLAIIDLTGGQQPMLSSDRSIAISFNGEIYNFHELRQELAGLGHSFRTNSDTEVIIQSWRQWGTACLSRLRGMFAFALFDMKEQSLLLARDRLGEKPLFYAEMADGTLIFASELKALEQCSALSRHIDPTAVEDYFSYGYIPDPKTIYSNVRKLEAGSFVLLKKGKSICPQRYWEILPAAVSCRSNDDLAEELIHRLGQAVKSQLVADVPIGTFLSGGVDSSAITALAASASSDALSTFTIGFDEAGWDERPFAEQVAKRYHTRASVELAQSDDFDTLDRLPSIFDEPFGDSSAIPTFRLCKLASRTVKVALSGDGGDELFAGYRRYKFHGREERFRRLLPTGFRESVFGTLGRIYPQLDWLPRPMRARQTFAELGHSSAEGYFENVRALSANIQNRLFRAEFSKRIGGYRSSDLIANLMERSPVQDPVGMAQYVDLNTWLVGDILAKVDRAAMACSLEVRVPMLDPGIVEWAMGLPPQFRLRGGESKWLLKKALEPLLPNSVLYRRKQGFSVPLANWFRSPLGKRLESRIDRSSLGDYIELGFAKKLLAEHMSGWADHSRALWLLWTFEAFLERSSTTSAARGHDALAVS